MVPIQILPKEKYKNIMYFSFEQYFKTAAIGNVSQAPFRNQGFCPQPPEIFLNGTEFSFKVLRLDIMSKDISQFLNNPERFTYKAASGLHRIPIPEVKIDNSKYMAFKEWFLNCPTFNNHNIVLTYIVTPEETVPTFIFNN